MAILTGLVIATIIITAAYVGYNAWEDSLHEEVEKHSENIEFEKVQAVAVLPVFHIPTDLNSVIG